MPTAPSTGVTVVYDDKVNTLEGARAAGEDLWVTMPDLKAATGWELQPEGVCRQDVCVPLPREGTSRFVSEEVGGSLFNLAEFARLVEQPFARDDGRQVWYFGQIGWEWKDRLTSAMAPDFTLPDFHGKLHSLSDYRGRKVFLLCWASW